MSRMTAKLFSKRKNQAITGLVWNQLISQVHGATNYEQAKTANSFSESTRPPREHRGADEVTGTNDPRRAGRTVRLARVLAGDPAGGVFLLRHLLRGRSGSSLFP